MSAQVKQSIKDIIPTLPEPIPSQLISHVDSLYKLSLLKLPVLSNNSEIGRYQICAFFAVDKLRHKLELPEPLVDKIPIAPRHLNKIFDDFRENVLGLERLNTPKGSPRKAPRGPGMGMSPGRSLPLTPTRQRSVVGDGDMSNTPRISSPLKRLQELQGEVTTPKRGKLSATGFSDIESPFNPKKSAAGTSPVGSVPGSPLKSKRIVTIPELIAFANHFFIPASVTPQLILSFGKLRQKFAKKNEWLLVCGMIHTAYIRINHQILAKKIGSKSEFEDQLFQYQKGGLMKWNMLIWCTIVSDMLKNEYWLIELERQFSANRLKFLNLLEREKEDNAKLGAEINLRMLGSMIDASIMFNSQSQQLYYDTWTEKVMERINSQNSD